jgi:hypothetical protein
MEPLSFKSTSPFPADPTKADPAEKGESLAPASAPPQSPKDSASIGETAHLLEEKFVNAKTADLRKEIGQLEISLKTLDDTMRLPPADKLRAAPTRFPSLYQEAEKEAHEQYRLEGLHKSHQIGEFFIAGGGAATIYFGMQAGLNMAGIAGIIMGLVVTSLFAFPKIFGRPDKSLVAKRSGEIMERQLSMARHATTYKLSQKRKELSKIMDELQKTTSCKHGAGESASDVDDFDDCVVVAGVKLDKGKMEALNAMLRRDTEGRQS